MNPHHKTLLALVAALVMTSGFTSGTVSPYTAKVVLPEGGEARSLSVYLPAGKLRIVGAEGNTLHATGTPLEAPILAQADEAPAPRSGKRAPESRAPADSEAPPDGLVFWVREGGIDLTVGSSDGPLDVVVRVPRDLAIRVESQSASKILVEDVAGDIVVVARWAEVDIRGATGSIYVETVQGSIRLVDITGPVEANTDHGRIEASLREVSPGKPIWLTAAVGPIDVSLPDNADATLRMRSTWGDIYSDFDDALAPRSKKAEPAPERPAFSGKRAPKLDSEAETLSVTTSDMAEEAKDETRVQSTRRESAAPEETPPSDRLSVRGGRSGEVSAMVEPMGMVQPPTPKRYVGRIGLGGADIRLTTGSKHIHVRRLKTK